MLGDFLGLSSCENYTWTDLNFSLWRDTPYKPEEGWVPWTKEPPPEGKLLQIMRPEWDKPALFTRAKPYEGDFQNQRYMNCAGLYWRLTGIGKETK
jgi:hypothetical protein